MLTEQDLDNKILEPITYEELLAAVPKQIKSKIPKEMVDTLNNIVSDPHHAKTFRDNFISYINVMQEGTFTIYEYLNAVKYVSYKLMGFTNRDSWIKVFPDRFMRLTSRGANDKEISAHYTGYNKSKLVNLIYEQTMIPIYVLNQDVHQRAINVLADLMLNARSDMAKVKAAESLLNHLKKPETKQIDLNIGINPTSEMEEMRDILNDVVFKQKELIESGMSTKEVVQIPLVKSTSDEEIIDVDYEESLI